jgi:hypothetical protein
VQRACQQNEPGNLKHSFCALGSMRRFPYSFERLPAPHFEAERERRVMLFQIEV